MTSDRQLKASREGWRPQKSSSPQEGRKGNTITRWNKKSNPVSQGVQRGL